MKRCLMPCLLLLFASSSAWAFGWADLWHTPEQRGQQMLDAGHPDAAAQTFHDPRRRAYAQAKAGQYDAAAQTLAAQQDADSLYNRGNALARAGKLTDALAAYDRALAKNPQDKDARRNRERVAEAIKRQAAQSQKNNSSQAGQSGAQSSPQQGRDKQDAQNGSGKSSSGTQNGTKVGDNQKNADKPNGSQGNSSQPQGNSPGATKSGVPQAGGQTTDAGKTESGNAGTQKNRPTSSPQGSAGSAKQDDAAQARRDAEAAAALANGQSGPGNSRGVVASAPAGDGGPLHAAPASSGKPKSERAMAMEQWLQRIPDDPGGLLRRKFLIEHQLKVQENSQ
jgi:Ca-activated chloride channel homolog